MRCTVALIVITLVCFVPGAASVAARSRAGAEKWGPVPDPIHGLESFCERAGHKPWDLYWRKDHLITHRVVFKDRKYGTWLWMLDNSPSVQSMYTASVWCPWNIDGSILLLMGPRRTPGRTRSAWQCNADFSRLSQWPGGIPVWDMEDPNVYYTHRRKTKRVRKINVRTGKQRVLASWEPHLRERCYGLTRDNLSVFVHDHDGGLWVPYTPGEKPLPRVRVNDGWSVAPNRKEFLGKASAATPTLNGFATKSAKYGHLFRINIGTRVYTDTGRTERVIVPFSGHTEYLKTFASGRVKFPADAKAPGTRDIDELFKIYHLYPRCSHGHSSFSPDDGYVCWDGDTLAGSHRVRDVGDYQKIIASISPNGGIYHTCWFYDPRFYVTHVRSDTRSYARSINASLLCQVFCDGTWQPICDTKARPVSSRIRYTVNAYPTFSRDTTKVHYGSNMTGAAKTYIAVMARPQPPCDVMWKAESPTRQSRYGDGAANAVVLNWTAPRHHREIKGYLVYRSLRSGDGYELLTPEPVDATTWRDVTVKRGRPYYYVITSLEQCGLESGYSAEAARAGVGLRARASQRSAASQSSSGIRNSLVIYAETEDALAGLKTGDKPGVSRGRDALRASNWYYVYRSPKAEVGSAKLSLHAPASADYVAWLRVRRIGKVPARWNMSVGGNPLAQPSVR